MLWDFGPGSYREGWGSSLPMRARLWDPPRGGGWGGSEGWGRTRWGPEAAVENSAFGFVIA